MKVRFLPAAEAELVREAIYYAKNARAGTAARFEAAVKQAVAMAKRFPEGGAPAYLNSRTFKVKDFPFLLVYRRSAREILVVAVAPTSREPMYWSVRLGDG